MRLQNQKIQKIRQWIPLYIMLLPGVVYLLINNYIPIAGIVVAFKKFTPSGGLFFSKWNGLKNFNYLVGNPDIAKIMRNTLLYNLAFLVINNVLGIALAILITDVASERLRKLFQSSILLPFLISIVVVSYIVFALFSHENGMMNNSILPFFRKNAVQWYNEKKWWPLILISVNTWKNVGYGTLIYIAAIAGVDPTYYEAAELDGAGKWQQIKNVTIPCLRTAIITLVILGIGRIFYSDFGLFYQVPQNSGSLFDITNTVDTYVYRALMISGGVGKSAAAGLLQSVIGFILVMLSNAFARKISPESAIF
mgnify:CR=1 FL=1